MIILKTFFHQEKSRSRNLQLERMSSIVELPADVVQKIASMALMGKKNAIDLHIENFSVQSFLNTAYRALHEVNQIKSSEILLSSDYALWQKHLKFQLRLASKAHDALARAESNSKRASLFMQALEHASGGVDPRRMNFNNVVSWSRKLIEQAQDNPTWVWALMRNSVAVSDLIYRFLLIDYVSVAGLLLKMDQEETMNKTELQDIKLLCLLRLYLFLNIQDELESYRYGDTPGDIHHNKDVYESGSVLNTDHLIWQVCSSRSARFFLKGSMNDGGVEEAICRDMVQTAHNIYATRFCTYWSSGNKKDDSHRIASESGFSHTANHVATLMCSTNQQALAHFITGILLHHLEDSPQGPAALNFSEHHLELHLLEAGKRLLQASNNYAYDWAPHAISSLAAHMRMQLRNMLGTLKRDMDGALWIQQNQLKAPSNNPQALHGLVLSFDQLKTLVEKYKIITDILEEFHADWAQNLSAYDPLYHARELVIKLNGPADPTERRFDIPILDHEIGSLLPMSQKPDAVEVHCVSDVTDAFVEGTPANLDSSNKIAAYNLAWRHVSEIILEALGCRARS